MKNNPSYLCHIALVKLIDKLFYQKHDSRRTHKRAYELIIRPLFGICEDTFRNYRKFPEERLTEDACLPHLKLILTIDVETLKALPMKEAERFLAMLCDTIADASKRMKNKPRELPTASRLRRCMIRALAEESARTE